jgi:hypothetical protein
MDALRDIPSVEAPLKTKKGFAFLQKTDIFKRIMYFGFEKDNNWYPVSIEKVSEILEMNKKGIQPESLETLVEMVSAKELKEAGSLNTDLESLDRKYSEEQQKKKKKKSRNNRNKSRSRPLKGGTITPKV